MIYLDCCLRFISVNMSLIEDSSVLIGCIRVGAVVVDSRELMFGFAAGPNDNPGSKQMVGRRCIWTIALFLLL